MLIGLISDTHIRVKGYRNNLGQLCASELPPQVMKVFRGVDLILHSGDIYAYNFTSLRIYRRNLGLFTKVVPLGTTQY